MTYDGRMAREVGEREPVHIETSRLILRELVDDDFERAHGWAVDPEVSRYMEWGPNGDAETRAFLARAAAGNAARPRRAYELGIVLRETGVLIGACGVRAERPGAHAGHFGYTLARAHWGRGYATEAGRALLALGFEQLGLHRLWATCRPGNVASVRVLEKLGLRREGHLRHTTRIRGEWQDSLLFARLSTDDDPRDEPPR